MRGFTLLELMVAVTIIAILTAAAIPTYQNYMLRSKLGTARVYADSYATKVKDFYRDYGRFPTDTDLGVSSTVPDSVAEYLYPPYLAYITMEPQTTDATQCAYSVHTTYFSNYSGDYFANGNSRYVVYYTYFIAHNGIMDQQCAFYEYDPSSSGITDNKVFVDCILTDDPDSSAIMDFINSACS